MARSRKGQFKRKARRRTKPKTNLLDIGVSLAVANGITQGLFQSNVVDFLTGMKDGQYAAGGDGSFRLTLPEMLGIGKNVKFGGNYGANHNLGSVIQSNFKANTGQIMFAAIGLPVVAKMAKKVLRKPVLTPANKLLKMTGLDVKV